MLVRYDSSLPTFLKKDWSASGVGFIIMQPNIDKVSLTALKVLQTTGENTSDVNLKGARLRAILFVSRKCTEVESHHHNFVGEVATSRWAISKNRVYFWGSRFYWLCDMKIGYSILNYDRHLRIIRRWT